MLHKPQGESVSPSLGVLGITMKLVKTIPFVLIAFALTACITTTEQRLDRKELEIDCVSRQINGTFVMFDPLTEIFHVSNLQRAQQRFIPASTFKIVNTLIGLETRTVKSVDEVLPYGSKPQLFKQWEHDMPLREAIKLSAIPIYQELARRIGVEQMSASVKDLGYGNTEIGSVIDRFWLDGPLAISAIEQTQFLAKLTQGQLVVRTSTVTTLNEITLQEQAAQYSVHHKTGWVFDTTPQIGWVVGWVTRQEAIYPFALNMDMSSAEDASKRWPIAKECLKSLGKVP